MEKKKPYLLDEDSTERKIIDLMNNLELEETQQLLKDYEIDCTHLDEEQVADIKQRVALKIDSDKSIDRKIQVDRPMGSDQEMQDKRNGLNDVDKEVTKKRSRWKGFVAIAAVLAFFIITVNFGDSIAHGVNRIFGLIPGVGIVQDNQEILYRLKASETATTDQGSLKILSAVATKNSMTVSFSYERKDITEEQLIQEKTEEWERLHSGEKLNEKNIYLVIGNERFKMTSFSSAGGGLTEYYTSEFELTEAFINPVNLYTIQYQDYLASADFKIIALEQHNRLDDIGTTDVHNNISLTAMSSIADNLLKVNIYPTNYSKYNLVSFESEYDMQYFGKKIALKTENGYKEYTLPGSYGSGMNAAYGFDISDGSKEFEIQIPFVVVESNEEGKITLPIPKVGEIVDVNREISFEEGSVIIRSVQKLLFEDGNPNGDLRVALEYKSLNESQQLVGVKLTRKKSEGWSEEYDKDGRLIAINYMLDKSDRNKLKLDVVKPRYVFLNEYNLVLDGR